MRATTVITGKFDAKFCEPQSLQEFLDKGGESLLYACIYEHAGCQDADDLYQDCLITAARCIEAFDYSRMDVKLTTYIWKSCENTIKMLFRKRTSHKAKDEDTMVIPMTDEVLEMDDHTAPDLDEDVERASRAIALHKAIEDPKTGLTDDERKIIKMTLEGYSQTKIGKAIGFSQSVISVKYTQALAKLREALKDLV